MMYPKIENVFERGQDGELIEGKWRLPELAYLAELPWIWTEKIDGMNIRVIVEGDIARFAGRTDRAQIPPLLVRHLEAKFAGDLGGKIGAPNMVLYGEGYGHKIQNGDGYLRADNAFVLFDVRVGQHWLPRKSVEEIAIALEVPVVPCVGVGSLSQAIEYVRAKPRSLFGDCLMEGLVCRPQYDLLNRHGERVIVKIKARDFGLQNHRKSIHNRA
jgi:hypothetical protein